MKDYRIILLFIFTINLIKIYFNDDLKSKKEGAKDGDR